MEVLMQVLVPVYVLAPALMLVWVWALLIYVVVVCSKMKKEA
jgi:hypothetical protein